MRSLTGDAENEEQELLRKGDAAAHGEVRLSFRSASVDISSLDRTSQPHHERLTMTEMIANWWVHSGAEKKKARWACPLALPATLASDEGGTHEGEDDRAAPVLLRPEVDRIRHGEHDAQQQCDLRSRVSLRSDRGVNMGCVPQGSPS